MTVLLEGAKAPKMQSKAAFDRLVHKREGKTHREERTLEKVQCQLCGFVLQRQGLKQHQLRKICERGRETWTTSQENPVNQQSQENHAEEPETEEQLPQEYCVFIDKSGKVECAVLDCPGRYSDWRMMRLHFRDMHPDDTIEVEQEGCFPRCVRCNMFVRTVGMVHHQATKMCNEARNIERREKQKVATPQHAGMKANIEFTVNGKPIEIVVEEFEFFLGRIVTNEKPGLLSEGEVGQHG
jgi:hypothetical protein